MTKAIEAFTTTLITAATAIQGGLVKAGMLKGGNAHYGRLFINKAEASLADVLLPTMSAHQTLEWRMMLDQHTLALHQAAIKSGLLDVGLGALSIDIVTNLHGTLSFKILHSGESLRSRPFLATSPSSLTKELTTAYKVLGHPSFGEGPLRTFMVDHVHVRAPSPQAAVLLCFLGRDPARVARILSGKRAGNKPLRIAEVLTEDGESLFNTP